MNDSVGNIVRWSVPTFVACFSAWKLLHLLYRHLNTLSTTPEPLYACGFTGLIGNTPMIELKSLSKLTGCRILAKAEYLNPGGSSKDRVAKGIIEDAEQKGLLSPGGTIVEGTSGSTGISLAQIARAKQYKCIIVMPDDVAIEKRMLLEKFGAEIQLVKPASIVNENHYVNAARKRAQQIQGGYFVDQFENNANYQIHYDTTGPEIWKQTNGHISAFVMSSGTTVSCAKMQIKKRI